MSNWEDEMAEQLLTQRDRNLKDAYHNALVDHRAVKPLAAATNLPTSTLYGYATDERVRVPHWVGMELAKVVGLGTEAGQALARELTGGLFYLRNIPHGAEATKEEVVLGALGLPLALGEVLKEVSEAMEDGLLTKGELNRIRDMLGRFQVEADKFRETLSTVKPG